MRTRIQALAVLALIAGTPAPVMAANAVAGEDEVLSFDMWCLEMRLYPQVRCDARGTTDVRAYEQYRTALERFLQDRAARQTRDKQIQERLNRDTTAPQPGTPAR